MNPVHQFEIKFDGAVFNSFFLSMYGNSSNGAVVKEQYITEILLVLYFNERQKYAEYQSILLNY